MALFSGLSERLSHIFSKITKRGKLTELEIKEAMREVRIALLEADVNYKVVKDFIKNVSEKAVGEEVLKSLTPAQQVIKIVNEDLTKYLKHINTSTLLIWGEHDKDTPLDDGKLMNKEIEDSGLVIIPNASHFPYLEYPYYINKIVLEFLKTYR